MAPAAVISLSEGRRGGPALRLAGDRHLSRLASKGDARAFAAIYERHHQDLYRYCRSITGNAEDASDALQSTMAAALRSLPGERREVALRPWLFRVAHNEAISLIRRRRPAAELSEDSASAAPGPHGLACMRERVTVLVENLRDLPERQRGALVMRELNGLDYDEIGTALGVSSPAARQAVYEARLALTELEEGREMECDSVRRSISARDGRMMRGRRLRAHLRGCRSCTNFSEQTELRRSAMSSVFPPLPAAAGAAILAGVLGGAGAACVGTGASVGAAAGAGSSGIMSILASGLSQAAGASGAAKGAAAVVAVAVASVGTVEVAKEAVKDAPPPKGSSVTAKTPRAHAPDGARSVAADSKTSRRTPQGAGRATERRFADGGGQAADGVAAPVRAHTRRPRTRALDKVEPSPIPAPVQAPTQAPRAPVSTTPVAATPIPQPWQQQYQDGVARYQDGMDRYRAGMEVVQKTMDGMQQMMNGLFSGTSPR